MPRWRAVSKPIRGRNWLQSRLRCTLRGGHASHKHCRVITDCEFAKRGIEVWARKWELNGWRTTGGERVSHSDVWKRILVWLRRFEDAEDRILEVVHVKAHSGIKGNERADELAARGSRLRHNLMVQSQPAGWFRGMVERYYRNRI